MLFRSIFKIKRSIERSQEKAKDRSLIYIKNFNKQSKNISKRIKVPHHFRIQQEEIINTNKPKSKLLNFKYLDFNAFQEKNSSPKGNQL